MNANQRQMQCSLHTIESLLLKFYLHNDNLEFTVSTVIWYNYKTQRVAKMADSLKDTCPSLWRHMTSNASIVTIDFPYFWIIK